MFWELFIYFGIAILIAVIARYGQIITEEDVDE